jgi:uncharacterized protein
VSFPLIDDPAFYAIAAPAVLLMGLAKSGFLGGFGSLAVPLMALTGRCRCHRRRRSCCRCCS